MFVRESLSYSLATARRRRRRGRVRTVGLTMIPVLTAIPLPQYVLGTMSPKPTLRKVIAINHIALRRFACSSSWNLEHTNMLIRSAVRRVIGRHFRVWPGRSPINKLSWIIYFAINVALAPLDGLNLFHKSSFVARAIIPSSNSTMLC